MMRDEKLLTGYLDYHAETLRLMRDRTLENAEQSAARAESGEGVRLWQACVDDGWTTAELNAAFERRFGKQG